MLHGCSGLAAPCLFVLPIAVGTFLTSEPCYWFMHHVPFEDCKTILIGCPTTSFPLPRPRDKLWICDKGVEFRGYGTASLPVFEMPILVPHVFFIPRQATLHFLIPALPTPLWRVKPKCTAAVLFANGKD